MSSSRKGAYKILGVISRTEAEELLLGWANLPDLPPDLSNLSSLDTGAYERLMERHPQVFGHMQARALHFVNLRDFRDRLRKAWVAVDRRHREWHIFQLRSQFNFSQILDEPGKTSDLLEAIKDPDEDRYQRLFWEPPPLTALEAAMFYFQAGIADKAKYCGGPGCPAPYFIAIKRWQKYCSEACAGPANREAKRKWWHENKGKGLL